MRTIAALLTAALIATTLVACGGDKPAATTAAAETTAPADTTAAPSGAVYDTGVFKVSIPDGWTAVPVDDLFSDEEDAVNPEQLYITTAGVDDYYMSPYMLITYYEPDSFLMSAKDLYEDAEDIESTEIGGHLWEGYGATSLGTPFIDMSSTFDGSEIYNVTLFYEVNGKSYTIKDADVQSIISSITTN